MKETGTVVSIQQDQVSIRPNKTAACATCHSDCEKSGTVFTVYNTRNFAVKNGDSVTFGISKKFQFLQGFLSLLLPLFCAVGGFFAANPIMNLFGKTASEGIKAAFVLAFLALSALAVFIITRKNPLPGKLEIYTVL